MFRFEFAGMKRNCVWWRCEAISFDIYLFAGAWKKYVPFMGLVWRIEGILIILSDLKHEEKYFVILIAEPSLIYYLAESSAWWLVVLEFSWVDAGQTEQKYRIIGPNRCPVDMDYKLCKSVVRVNTNSREKKNFDPCHYSMCVSVTSVQTAVNCYDDNKAPKNWSNGQQFTWDQCNFWLRCCDGFDIIPRFKHDWGKLDNGICEDLYESVPCVVLSNRPGNLGLSWAPFTLLHSIKWICS